MPASSLRALMRSPLALLIALRWLAILAQSLTVALVDLKLGITLPMLPVSLILAAQLLFNLWTMRTLARWPGRDVPADDLALQFTFDILALAIMLYYTGGAFNPFVSLFLVPLAIAAVMLPVAYATGMVILTVFLYGSLMDSSIPLPSPDPSVASQLSLHLFGMWVNFIISACLIAGFLSWLSLRLRDSQQALRQVREVNLRQEQILALGTLAAGTAHELGTPLATMAVVMADLEEDVPDNLKADVRLVLQQIGVCKEKLAQLVREVRQGGAEPEWMTVESFFTRIVGDFRLLHPAVPLQTACEEAARKILLRVDRQLQQAMLNLLNNAASASPSEVMFACVILETQVRFDIADRGPGFAEAELSSLGIRIVSSRSEEGMGIGLLLSNATVERHGGEVRVSSRRGGGALVTVSLPRGEVMDGQE